MTKDDTVASFFVKITRIGDDLLAIDEIVPKKEPVITTLLGFPPTWSARALGLNIWKETPSFEQLWNSCSQKEMRISLVTNNEEEKVSNAYSAYDKKRNFKKSKGPRRKVDMSKIECYQCHRMGHSKSDCLDNPKNKKRNRDQANVAEEGSPKKNKAKELDIRDLHY